MRGADLLVQTLAAAGVSKIFALSGNQIMPIFDACIDTNIEIVHVRHEAAAVFMADAYAQLTGQIGVCLVTAAPGAMNALGPLFSARQAESPVLLLTGDSPLSQDGKGAFQELDQVSVSTSMTKLSFRSMAAEDLGEDLVRACDIALSGRPGPVHMALPFDVVEGQVPDNVLPAQFVQQRTPTFMIGEDTALVIKHLAEAERPLVLCGPALNVTRSGDQLVQLAAAMDVPVVPMESPRGLKDPSLGAFRLALGKADIVVCLGKSVNFTLGFGGSAVCDESCQWIVLDADDSELERARLNLGSRLSHRVKVDPRDVVSSLIKAGSAGTARRGWRNEVDDLICRRSHSISEPEFSERLQSASLCAVVQRHIAEAAESVVICDGGEFGQWGQAATNGTYRVINGSSGAIGGGLCYAVAAKKARPDATVFTLMGDGTVGFHLAEFETAVRANTPFVAVIGNDTCWNAEHLIQMRDYGPDRLIACQLSDARYDQVVTALGGHGEYVTQYSELDDALSRAVSSGLVACVNVQIQGLPAPEVATIS